MPTYATFSSPTSTSAAPKIRTDTRLYLKVPKAPGLAQHDCVGSIYLHNPGSASPSAHGLVKNDNTLNVIDGIFRKAMACKKFKNTYSDPYIEILNLCYYATPNKKSAYAHFISSGSGLNQNISPKSNFVWIAWGTDLSFQGPLITAILDIQKSGHPAFCYDGSKKSVVDWDPNVSFPAHPSRSASRYPNYASDVATKLATYL